MSTFWYILLFILFIVGCRMYYLFFRKEKVPKPVKNRIKEGFASLDNCLEQGYPDDFCKRVPLEACVSNCPIGTFMPKTFVP